MSRAARASIVATALASAVTTLAATSGCSLVSGWSDLQTAAKDGGGAKPGTPGTPGGTDAGGTDPDTDAGTGPRNDGGVTPSGVSCGAGECAADEGCCVTFGGGKTCAKATACDTSQGAFFLACTSSASCDSRAPICCFDFANERSACAGFCGPGNPAVCDGAPNTCPSGMACTDHATGIPDIRTCK